MLKSSMRPLYLRCLLLSLFVCLPAVHAAEDLSDETLQQREVEWHEKIDALQARVQTLAKSENSRTAKGLNVTLEQLKERTETTQEILDYANRQLLALGKYRTLRDEKKQLAEQLATGEALTVAEDPPYSLKLYDQYASRLAEARRAYSTAEMGLNVSEKAFDRAKERLKDASLGVRGVKSHVFDPKKPRETQHYQWQLSKAERQEELARTISAYQETALLNAQQSLELAGLRTSTLQRITDAVRRQLHFDAEDLEKQLANLDERRATVQAAIGELLKKQQNYEKLQLRAQRRLGKASSERETELARQALLAADLWRQALQNALEQHETEVNLLNLQKQIWKQRYELIRQEPDTETLRKWKKAAGEQGNKLQQAITLSQEQQTSLQLQLAKLDEQLATNGIDAELKGSFAEQRRALREQTLATVSHLTLLSTSLQMNQRFSDELAQAQASVPLWERLQAVWSKIASVWQFELVAVDDQSVTIGKVVLALAILVIGVSLTGRLAFSFQALMRRRFRITASSAAITGKLFYYLMLLFVLLFAMRLVNIPLTAFTFLGGAIAIGVGFGAQKLINNFISGFIIMAEQPIKVGDLIQMDKELGWIEDIGVRSTRVRTFDNIDILVPNSFFLENNIINWTHNDNKVRGQVSIGVAYGSPTREVKRLLLKAAREHGEVLKEPEPFVWFNDFGDNALIFDLYYWISVSERTGRQRVASDLRFMIDEFFRDAGITIAFPQRDVHLVADGGPLPVRIVEGDAGQGKASSAQRK